MKHNGKEIQIAFLALPVQVRGQALEYADEYLVGINEGLAGITKRHTIGHELAHIFLNHFDDSCIRPSDSEEQIETKLNTTAAREKEKQANKAAWHYYRKYRDEIRKPARK